MKAQLYNEVPNKKIIICSQNPDIALSVKDSLISKYNSPLVCSPDKTLKSILDNLKNDTKVLILYHLKGDSQSQSVLNEEKALGLFIKDNQNAEKIIVLVNSPNTEQGIRLLHLGIRGYANTYINSSKLLTAIEVVFQGEIWAGQDILMKLLSFKSSSNNLINESENVTAEQLHLRNLYDDLSPREKEVIHHILKGHKNKEIAETLCVSERTIKAHLSSIFKKTGTKNRFELSVKFNNDSYFTI